jgi:hypothetical protein
MKAPIHVECEVKNLDDGTRISSVVMGEVKIRSKGVVLTIKSDKDGHLVVTATATKWRGGTASHDTKSATFLLKTS